ncbi:MAG: Flp pilus assembly complex ATPase component TadA [Oscillospiraceae bacterium]|nr:Flp pilus assembly complex ATPase component TadA [Oscillospiraceae bacterium]
MDERLSAVPELFPEPYQRGIRRLLEEKGDRVEELRLRVDCPLSWTAAGREISLQEAALPLPSPALLEEIVQRASGRAVYAVEDQLRHAYLSLPWGHRLGLCGRAALEGERIVTIRQYQALNLRLARPLPGCADGPAAFLWAHPASTLILGPPGAGKTTVLRDLVRQISDRYGWRVGLIDERGELAACLDGRPQLPIGRRTDVLSACPKRRGVALLLRAMSPEWIAVDEITDAEDAEALARGAYCGARFLATAHASCLSDLMRRPVYRQLLRERIFENVALIRSDRRIQCERMDHGLYQIGGERDDPAFLGMDGPPRGAAAAADP